MSVRSLLGCGLAAWLAGCGGNVVVDGESAGGGDAASGGAGGGTSTPTSTTIPPPSVTPACLDYCAAAAQEKGCFTVEDCHVRCMALYSPGCEAEVEAVLACLPDWLTPACQITYAEDFEDGCGPAIDELWLCGAGAIDGCSSSSSQLVGSTACQGDATCETGELAITCTGTGACTCFVEGDAVGECAMPFTGNEPCVLPLSCCRPIFGL